MPDDPTKKKRSKKRDSTGNVLIDEDKDERTGLSEAGKKKVIDNEIKASFKDSQRNKGNKFAKTVAEAKATGLPLKRKTTARNIVKRDTNR